MMPLRMSRRPDQGSGSVSPACAGGVQERGDASQESFGSKRLLDEAYRGIDVGRLQDVLIEVPGHEHDTERGIPDAQAREEVRSTSAGQHHVRNEHIDLTDVGNERFGLFGRRGLIDAMAGPLEDDTGEVSHGFLVFDDQDGRSWIVVAQCGRFDAWREPLASGTGDSRQINPEGRSPSRLALYRDVTVRGGDDPMNRRQPESGSLSAILRREERLEELRSNFLAHAHAGIGDGEHHVVASCDLAAMSAHTRLDAYVRRVDPYAAPLRHEIGRAH